jgi:hypothetical protein
VPLLPSVDSPPGIWERAAIRLLLSVGVVLIARAVSIAAPAEHLGHFAWGAPAVDGDRQYGVGAQNEDDGPAFAVAVRPDSTLGSLPLLAGPIMTMATFVDRTNHIPVGTLAPKIDPSGSASSSSKASLVPVPEPSTAALLALGLAGLGMRRRRG